MDQDCLIEGDVLAWLRAHRLPERQPGDVTLAEASEAYGLGPKQMRDKLRKWVKAGMLVEIEVRCDTGQPMAVWRKVEHAQDGGDN